jgi:hypothetical protein
MGEPVRMRLVSIAVILIGLGLAAGCGTVNDARQVIDRAHLVNDLANRLNRSADLTYVAEYQLSSGRTGTIAQAQHPRRSAYAYPGGKVTFSTTATTDCRGSICTLTAPAPTNAALPSGSLDAPRAHGLIAPTTVIGLLTAAALDTDAVIEQSDTTIAGQHATCVDASGVDNAAASAFTACITTDGILGSFDGVISGQPTELSLTRYTTVVPADAFDLPVTAKIIDQRNR